MITIEYRLSKQGDNRSRKTRRDILTTHQRTTVIVLDEESTIHHIRHSGQAEAENRDIYKKLSTKNTLSKVHYKVAKVTGKD